MTTQARKLKVKFNTMELQIDSLNCAIEDLKTEIDILKRTIEFQEASIKLNTLMCNRVFDERETHRGVMKALK